MARKTAHAQSTPDAQSDGRRAILEAARALLAEHGGSRFSLADVAARSGKNTALVGYHFGGKEQMLLAILDEDEETLMRPLEKLAAADMPAENKLARHISGMLELHAQRPYFNALIHELLRRSSPAAAKDIVKRFIRPLIDFHRGVLKQGEAEGVFRAVDPFAFHMSVAGGVDMMFAARATIEHGFGCRFGDPALRRQFAQDFTALILAGLRPETKKTAKKKRTA